MSLAGTDAFTSPLDTTYRVKIPYNRGDLDTPRETEKLYRKIKNAARTVCDRASEPSDPKRTRHYWECYETALTQAVNDINSSHLTALHQQQDKRRRPG